MKKLHHHLQSTEGRFVAGLVLVIVLLFAYYFYAMSRRGDVGTVENIVIKETDHIRGAQDAKLTLVEFGDYQCPACGVYEPLVRQVMKDNKTVLKVVFKHFPLTQIHQNALLAAKATEAAGLQGKFWEMHSKLFSNQDSWATSTDAKTVFEGYAKDLGLDIEKYNADLELPEVVTKIDNDQKSGIKAGVNSTPTFYLNGKKVSPQNYDQLKKLIDEATSTNS